MIEISGGIYNLSPYVARCDMAVLNRQQCSLNDSLRPECCAAARSMRRRVLGAVLSKVMPAWLQG